MKFGSKGKNQKNNDSKAGRERKRRVDSQRDEQALKTEGLGKGIDNVFFLCNIVSARDC